MNMQDIHTGFQDLNRTTDTHEFFQFLDAANALEIAAWLLSIGGI